MFNPDHRTLPSAPPLGLIDMGGNDYLGLSRHPEVIAAGMRALEHYGAGSTASRLVGSPAAGLMLETEEALAAFHRTEAALLFNTGWQANTTALPALLPEDALVLMDKLCHRSLIDGVRHSGAAWQRFAHNDLDRLEALLKKERARPVWVVTESVFSMDGDVLPLDELLLLKQRYGFSLYLDEAHSVGVLGDDGRGMAAAYPNEIEAVLGTCGKAMGSFGAYLALGKGHKDQLVNRCAGLIYSTALPPSVTACIGRAAALIPAMESERTHLRQCHRMLAPGAPFSPIIPVITGSSERALALADTLKMAGFFAPAIRPPTVAKGAARVRLTLSSLLKTEDVQRVRNILATPAV